MYNIYDIMIKRGKGDIIKVKNVISSVKMPSNRPMTEEQFQKSIELLDNLDKVSKSVKEIYALYGKKFNKQREEPNIFIFVAICTYLLQDYKIKEVAYIMGREQSTIRTLKKRSENYFNDRIARLIINDVLENCRIRIKGRDVSL